jgi:hypothetical protein
MPPSLAPLVDNGLHLRGCAVTLHGADTLSASVPENPLAHARSYEPGILPLTLAAASPGNPLAHARSYEPEIPPAHARGCEPEQSTRLRS